MKSKLIFLWCGIVCLVGLGTSGTAQDAPKPNLPVIDMHLHALPANGWPGGPSVICPGGDFAPFDPITKWDPGHMWQTCPHPLTAPTTNQELVHEILAVMAERNVVLAATSGPMEDVRRYREADSDRFLPALNVAVANLGPPDSLRKLIRKGDIAILGELAPEVEGISPDDERLEPYLALAEEMDIPVAIHVGSGAPYPLTPHNRAALNNPLLLEKVVIRHPQLRIYVMHAGWPMLNEMIYLLYLHPQVYVDVAAIDWILPRKELYRYLRGLVEAGFGERIMFGSDTSLWPQTLAIAIDSIESADFLSEAQKRDILYNNAARFLRLDKKRQTENQPQQDKTAGSRRHRFLMSAIGRRG